MKKVHLIKEDVKDERKIFVVLDRANLEVAIFKKHENVLLNGDDHANYIINKLKKDPADFRPDITHQCLLTLMDSTLNKNGKLTVYVTTASNQVIKIHHSTRIPRTFKRFSALFAQLLKRLSIRAEESSETLLEIVKSPVKQYLPTNAVKIAMSTKGRMVHMTTLARELHNGQPVVFVVGAVAKGNPTMDNDYIQDSVCISKYALSASVCLGRIMNTYEDLYEIM